MEIVRFIAIGLGVGVLSGALGIGGGVVLVPALMWICGLTFAEAAGTTLAVLVVPVVLPAAWEYYSRDCVNLKAAGFIACAFAVGGYGGAWLHHEGILPEWLLRLLFGLVMVYIAFNMIVMTDSLAATAAVGLTATVAAWGIYLWLRMLGKRALTIPKFDDQLRRIEQQGRGDAEYYI